MTFLDAGPFREPANALGRPAVGSISTPEEAEFATTRSESPVLSVWFITEDLKIHLHRRNHTYETHYKPLPTRHKTHLTHLNTLPSGLSDFGSAGDLCLTVRWRRTMEPAALQLHRAKHPLVSNSLWIGAGRTTAYPSMLRILLLSLSARG